MFIGHYAVAFGAKRLTPRVSLGTLFLCTQLADLIWPTLVLAGVERVEVRPGATAMTPLEFLHYPYSHSLLALAVWGTLVGIAYMSARRSSFAVALALAAVVVSHWVLDFVSHSPDMPLGLSEGHKLGLGLWDSVPATLAVESLLFAGGIAVYLRQTSARDRVGSVGFWTLIAFISVIYLASAFGPPPPSGTAVAWTDQGQWLLVAWAYWVDDHRGLRVAP